MRLSALPLVLAGLLGSAVLAPEVAQAYPYGDQRYSYDNYGPPSSRTYAPLPVRPYGYPVRRCNRGTVLSGAAMGGILGGVISGC